MKSRINFTEEIELPLRLDSGAQRSTMLTDVKWHVYEQGVQGIYFLCSPCIGHPCYGQLTAVQKGHLLTSVVR